MALSEFERKRCERIIGAFINARRPSPHIRDKLDLGFRVADQSVEIFEIRPEWQNPKQKMEHLVAKATFVRTQNLWRVFWMRSDLKWHGYEPNAVVRSLEAFLAVVDRDEYCCFFG